MTRIYKILIFLLLSYSSSGCECPLSSLDLATCNNYEIIFRGKIISVKDCDNNYGEAMFAVDELYKGNATREFKVLFECGVPCAQKLLPGQEWIIYSRYKQIDNALLDWCSRSRMHFSNEKEDFYTFTYGNDYDAEVKFLQTQLGVHRVLVNHQNQDVQRNIIPNMKQVIITILISLIAILLFYWLFNRFFK
jgi:hypothetical protein